MAKRGAKGAGNIRKRTITRNGKQYTYWDGRVTTGRDPTTGKQVQRYFSAKTQKEVLEKMQKVAVAVNDGTYTPPSKLTVGQWLTIWADNYLGGVKYNTVRIYKGNIKNHITPAPAASVMAALRAQRRRQLEAQLRAGSAWSNPHGLVFTGENGGRVLQQTVDKHFRALTKAAGLEGVRFHDLRHTYAVNAIRAGDDIKTIQSNLGHATAAFTLDRYAHFTERMRQDSAQRMEGFIKDVMKL